MAKEKKSSKRKLDEILPADLPADEKKSKKNKKHKKEKIKCEEKTLSPRKESKEKVSKNKSDKKKKPKKDKKDRDEVDLEIVSIAKAETLKPEEQSIRDKRTEKNSTQVAQVDNSSGWTDWNKTSFGGDAARKEKFLKLMGAKKSVTHTQNESTPAKKGLFGSLKSSLFQPKASASTYGTSLTDQAQQKIQSDLEHQFEEGVRFKKNMQRGSKRGLGA